MATTDTTAFDLNAYRVAMIEELGFSKGEAEALEKAYYPHTLVYKGKKGLQKTYMLRVDYHYVRKLLDSGATKEQILAILV